MCRELTRKAGMLAMAAVEVCAASCHGPGPGPGDAGGDAAAHDAGAEEDGGGGEADAGSSDPWAGYDLPPVADELGLIPTSPEPEPAGVVDVDATVDLAELHQEFLGFGMATPFMTQFSWALQGALGGDENPLLDDLFSPDGLGCNYAVLRAIVDGRGDSSGPLRFLGSYRDDHGRLRLDDPPLVSIVRYLERYGVDVVLRPEASPEEWVTSGPGPQGDPVDVLDPAAYGDWAEYLADYTAAVSTEAPGRVWAVTQQNEPDFVAEWTYLYYTPEDLLAFTRDHLRPALDARGLEEIVIVGPDVGTTWSLPDLFRRRYFTDELTALSAVHDFHTYDVPFVHPDEEDPIRRMQWAMPLFDGKPILIEYGNATSSVQDQAAGGTIWEMGLTARHLVRHLAVGRASYVTWFSGFWDNAPSGLLQVLAADGADEFEGFEVPLNYVRQPKYYAFMHFSRFAPLPSHVVHTDSGDWAVQIVGFLASDPHRLSLVVTNQGPERRLLSLALAHAPDGISTTFRQFRSTHSERFADHGTVEAAAGVVELDLPPFSISTLVTP